MAENERCVSEAGLASYLAGRLSEGALSTLEAHLDVCCACARVALEGARVSGIAGRRDDVRIFDVSQRIAGRYRIIAFLGAGGMGEVYEAHDETLDERIALKTVSAAATFDARAVARLKAEVLLARKVTNPNVCRIFDFGVHIEVRPDEDAAVATPFLTMELLRGATLAERIRGGARFGDAHVLGVARQLAAGLHAAHEAGVVHRDFKSDNIVLIPGPGGVPKALITDFGLAASVIAETEQQSSHPALYGTAHYLAPERIAGGPATKAADIYALGLVMQEMVSGVLASRRHERPGRAFSTSAVAPVIWRCLEVQPEHRPETAAAVLRMLEGLALTRPASPTPAGLVTRIRWRWLGAVAVLGLLSSLAVRSQRLDRGSDSAWARPELRSRAVAVQASTDAPAASPAGGAGAAMGLSPVSAPAVVSVPSPSRVRRAPRARTAPAGAAGPVVATTGLAHREAETAAPQTERVLQDEPIRVIAPGVKRAIADEDAPIDPLGR